MRPFRSLKPLRKREKKKMKNLTNRPIRDGKYPPLGNTWVEEGTVSGVVGSSDLIHRAGDSEDPGTHQGTGRR